MMTAGALMALQFSASFASAEGEGASPTTESSAQPAAAIQSKQESPAAPAAEAQDVLIHAKVPLGGYGGPDMRISTILSEPALLVGGQASWLMNHRYFFGVAGYGLATRHNAPNTMAIDGNPSTLGLVYGGLRFGVVATPNDLLHVALAALIGPGNLTGISSVPTRAELEVGYERRLGHAETFFVVEPEVAVEANLTHFMRAALGGSYRYVTGVQQPGLSTARLSGPAASLALKFGVF